jgi:hypothetical protein
MGKLGVGLLVSLSLFGSACVETGDEAAKHSTAYKLYVLDTGEIPLDESADEIRPYRRQLLLLSRGCTNPEERLADFALTIKEALGKEFIDVSTLEVMQLVNAGLGERPQDCKEAFALAGVLLQQQSGG